MENEIQLETLNGIATDERDLLQPPIYIIDLSLPPRERYKEVALAFKDRVQSLPVLFDQLAEDAGIKKQWARGLAKLFLRRVKRSEETEELCGISEVTGIDLYLLVNFIRSVFAQCTDPMQRSPSMCFWICSWCVSTSSESLVLIIVCRLRCGRTHADFEALLTEHCALGLYLWWSQIVATWASLQDAAF